MKFWQMLTALKRVCHLIPTLKVSTGRLSINAG